MCIEHGFGEAAGLEEGKTQQDRIAHTAPDGHDDIRFGGNVLHQHGVDSHADDDEECLKAQGDQRAQIVLAHSAAHLAAHHSCHRNRCNRGHK